MGHIMRRWYFQLEGKTEDFDGIQKALRRIARIHRHVDNSGAFKISVVTWGLMYRRDVASVCEQFVGSSTGLVSKEALAYLFDGMDKQRTLIGGSGFYQALLHADDFYRWYSPEDHTGLDPRNLCCVP
eukprot:Lankesteria_metandrocarpae@DN1648_c0_g1_i1.p1